MRASTDFSDLIKDKRVWIPAALVLAGIIGGGVWFAMSGTEHGNDAATLPAPGTLPANSANPGSVGGPGGGRLGASAGAPGTTQPGAPIAVGSKGTVAPRTGVTAPPPGGQTRTAMQVTAPAKPVVIPNSWAGAPIGYGGGATVGTNPIAQAPPTTGGMPTGPVVASAGAKPTPIKSNTPAELARIDPFVPFYKLIVEQPQAYSLIVPQRLASRPTPTPQPIGNIPPDIRFGPLPPVERRVAGVLFDGSVSAILETGTPGSASTDVRVIQPGATVPSGFANPDTLTVASISPSGVVLRAADGRTTTVKLSNVSAEFSDAFHNAANGPGTNTGGQQGAPPTGGRMPPGRAGTANPVAGGNL